MQAATWALDRGVCVVICNGMQEQAIKMILAGRKLGTFFTSGSASSTSTDVVAEQGECGGRGQPLGRPLPPRRGLAAAGLDCPAVSSGPYLSDTGRLV